MPHAIHEDPSTRALSAALQARGRGAVATTREAITAVLSAHVLHQAHAVERAATTLAAGLSGLRPRHRRPVASLMFVGPTGCGKSELAKALRLVPGPHAREVIRLDMSEYGDRTALGRLIGANRGYIGFDNTASLLTTRLRHDPTAVVIFDELEKADPSIHNVLLQLFDEGSLTDGSGSNIDASHAIIIATSNIGAEAVVRPPVGFNVGSNDGNTSPGAASRSAFLAAVRRELRPELIGRFDAIVDFQALSDAALTDIGQHKLEQWLGLARQAGWQLELDPGLPAWLAERCDPRAGARSIQQQIDTQLVATLAEFPCGPYRAVIDGGDIRWVATATER